MYSMCMHIYVDDAENDPPSVAISHKVTPNDHLQVRDEKYILFDNVHVRIYVCKVIIRYEVHR